MVNVFNIIVTSAMLVLGNDVNNPIPYCTVQLQQPATQEPQPRPEYDLFEDPRGWLQRAGRTYPCGGAGAVPGRCGNAHGGW